MVPDKPIPMVSIPSHLAYVNCLRAFVVAACKLYGLDDNTTEGIALAVHEAVTNVIRHGHRHQYDKSIQLTCTVHPDRLEIHIYDEGEPFDITQVPELDPAELRIGGRGVFLMRTLLDQISSEPRPGGGNHFRLVKFCSPQLPPCEPS
jgi:serine/threonine-protein kinase RsbW